MCACVQYQLSILHCRCRCRIVGSRASGSGATHHGPRTTPRATPMPTDHGHGHTDGTVYPHPSYSLSLFAICLFCQHRPPAPCMHTPSAVLTWDGRCRRNPGSQIRQGSQPSENQASCFCCSTLSTSRCLIAPCPAPTSSSRCLFPHCLSPPPLPALGRRLCPPPEPVSSP